MVIFPHKYLRVQGTVVSHRGAWTQVTRCTSVAECSAHIRPYNAHTMSVAAGLSSARSGAYSCAPRFRGALYSLFLDDSTPFGRVFGIGVIVAILVSVATVCAESVKAIHAVIGGHLVVMEVRVEPPHAVNARARVCPPPKLAVSLGSGRSCRARCDGLGGT